MDAIQQLGDVERRAGLFKYVIGHVNLRQTFTARGARRWLALAEATNSAQLGLQRGFKYGKYGIFEVVTHGGLLSMGLERGWHEKVGLSRQSW